MASAYTTFQHDGVHREYSSFTKVENSKGDVVLDPFMGSGSTGVACVKTDRQFIGVELDNKWVNVAEERISEASGS
jgi:tRNA/tmRNA/rRNA uracil-C5-methylase (TrmA/RlmC/RlmD family)